MTTVSEDDRIAMRSIARWRRDPVGFVREQFSVEPDEWQKDGLRAFVDPAHSRISLQACAGPGKSALLAWCGWHFLACQGDLLDHPNAVAISITRDNLKTNLWKELSKWQQRSPMLQRSFRWTAERISSVEHPTTWFLDAKGFAQRASAEEQAQALSGLHGKYVLALIDESGAIPPAVADRAEQALADGPDFGKILQSGNPTTRRGMLFKASQDPDWHVIRITGDPDDPKRSPRINIDWARARIAKRGRDDPWVRSYVLGLFPHSDINSLLDPDEVRTAMERVVHEHEYRSVARVIGVDVAREGDDASVIYRRQGIKAWPPQVYHGIDGLFGAGQVSRQWREWEADACFVDGTGGFGASWIDQLRVLGRSPVGIHFAGKPTDEQYANKRTEMWFAMAQWIREGGSLLGSPVEIVEELTVPTYSFKGDRIILEPKEDIKATMGRSPDLADALALTFAYPVHSEAGRGVVQSLDLHADEKYDAFYG